MKPTSYTLYFNNQWSRSDQLGNDFIEHAFDLRSGVSTELRSYGYNGSPHLFKAKKYLEELLIDAQRHHLVINKSVEELMGIAYELLERNHLINAKILPCIYRKGERTHLTVLIQKAAPFTIREKVPIDSITKENDSFITPTGQVLFQESNPLFFIKHGILYSPKVEENQSPGIIRDTIIECAIALGFPVIEKTIVVDEMADAEVVFFSNQTHEMSFVCQFEHLTFSTDWRDTSAMDLLMMFRQQATNEDFWNYSII